MEKFLKRFQKDINTKMVTCINGESIVKPFSGTYTEVRNNEETKEVLSPKKEIGIYKENQDSIYKGVIKEFLKEHPELSPNNTNGEKQFGEKK